MSVVDADASSPSDEKNISTGRPASAHISPRGQNSQNSALSASARLVCAQRMTAGLQELLQCPIVHNLSRHTGKPDEHAARTV
jgi:hypothetical protein